MADQRYSTEQVARLLDVVRATYEGATYLDRMAAFASELKRIVPYNNIQTLMVQPATMAAPPPNNVYTEHEDLGAPITQNYPVHYWTLDPCRAYCLGPGMGKLTLLSRFLSDRMYGHEEYSADLLRHADVRHILGGATPMPDGWVMVLSIQRGIGTADFRPDDVDAVQTVFPALARSAFCSLLLQGWTEASARSTEQADFGSVVFSRSGEIVGGDPSGRAILADLDTGDRLVSEALLEELQPLIAPDAAAWSTTRVWSTRSGGWASVTLACPDQSGDLAVVVRRLAPEGEAWAATEAQRVRLTPREFQAARLACEGLTNAQIGGRLNIAAHTVGVHLGRALAKLGASSRYELPTRLLGRR